MKAIICSLGETNEDLVARLDPLTSDDRKIIESELRESPATASLIRTLMATGGPLAVRDSALKAFANETDRKLFPETKGYWPALRAQVQKLLVALPAAMRQVADSMTLNEKLLFAEQVAQGKRLHIQLSEYPVEPMMGLGFFDVIAPIISSVAGAASSVYQTKVVSDAQKAIAKIKADTELKQLNVAMSLAKAQAAVQGAQVKILEDVGSGKLPATSAPSSTTITATVPTGTVTASVPTEEGILDKKVAGLPLWSIGLTAVGGLLLAFK